MKLFEILFFSVFALLIFKAISTFIKNENSPIVATKAQLISKKRDSYSNTDAVGNMTFNETLILIFALDTGSEIRFTVGGQIFRSVPEYEWGTLTFQGTRLLSFEAFNGSSEK